ncbi:hypothetical protein VNO77_26820 [Canavalia gladiata]|uniref:Uncharacterized protein n=1 Tax=Canavalia gladiata TaxID=3824 RepID=A0AAN9KWP5_CANGL
MQGGPRHFGSCTGGGYYKMGDHEDLDQAFTEIARVKLHQLTDKSARPTSLLMPRLRSLYSYTLRLSKHTDQDFINDLLWLWIDARNRTCSFITELFTLEE